MSERDIDFITWSNGSTVSNPEYICPENLNASRYMMKEAFEYSPEHWKEQLAVW